MDQVHQIKDYVLNVVQKTSLSAQLLIGLTIFWTGYVFVTRDRPIPGMPVVTKKLTGWKRFLPDGAKWVVYAGEMIDDGLSKHSGCFQVYTMSGYKVICPGRYTHEVSHNPSLTLSGAFKRDFFVDYPGFEAHKTGLEDGPLFSELIRVKLTQSMNLIYADLVDEMDDACPRYLSDDHEWRTYKIKDDVVDIVTRLTSRVLLGPELCRNEEWLKIAKAYAIDSVMGSWQLRITPAFLRPLVHWFIPTLIKLRQEVRDCNAMIMPEVERRKQIAEEKIKAGEKLPQNSDAIGWMVEIGRGRPVNYVAGNLALSMAAIHTTSRALTCCVVQLCETPEVISSLREEAAKALTEHGWTRTALYNMRLLDSFVKEVQRIYTLDKINLNRLAQKDVTLSDGTFLPEGTVVLCSTDRSFDPNIYKDPHTFDMTRFIRAREQPGQENQHQLATTSIDHISFGHGPHACPGRFFASDEIKICMAFMLLRYDFRYGEGQFNPPPINYEQMSILSPKLRIQMRRRKEEIDLVNPKKEVKA